jgi:ketosteroid isomerase-like protein
VGVVVASTVPLVKESITMSITTIPTRREQCQATPVAGDAATVRRFFEAWGAGDVSCLDGLVDPGAVLGPIVGLLYEREVYAGRLGVANAFRETAGRWDRFALTVDSVHAPGDGKVVAEVRLRLEKHGMSSEAPITVACAMRDGLIAAVVDSD